MTDDTAEALIEVGDYTDHAALLTRVAALESALWRIKRNAELSAAIMRAPARTGFWAGAERTAAQFSRIAAKVDGLEISAPWDCTAKAVAK